MISRLGKQVIVFAVGFISLFALLGYAGSEDYAQEVIQMMSQEAYDTISEKLGDGCSNKDIAREFMENRKYYESLN